ncbi:serine/threonine protein kinase [Trueperella sp. LYQ143]|uniref:serine/threonine protein kinase n=1 Tax=Trueperella sp. LYQ143 TaxID=3391059 RepID=UPI003982DEC7
MRESIGGYHLLAQIGAGGMSSVYRACDDAGNLVALKLLHPAIAAQPRARERLRREVAMLQRARGKYVAAVLDAETEDDDIFIVTELIDGPTLEADVFAQGPYLSQDLCELGEELSRALDSIHRVGVLHRDLKPSNVMMGAQGPVLIDFGIAQLGEDVRMTQTGAVTHTPGFCDPRVIRGAAPDEEADWWALAAVLAFAATGHAPFGTGGHPAIMHRVLSGQAALPGLCEPVAQAFRQALHPNVERRIGCAELLDVIQANQHCRYVSEDLNAEGAVGEEYEQHDDCPPTRVVTDVEQRAGMPSADMPPARGGHVASGDAGAVYGMAQGAAQTIAYGAKQTTDGYAGTYGDYDDESSWDEGVAHYWPANGDSQDINDEAATAAYGGQYFLESDRDVVADTSGATMRYPAATSSGQAINTADLRASGAGSGAERSPEITPVNSVAGAYEGGGYGEEYSDEYGYGQYDSRTEELPAVQYADGRGYPADRMSSSVADPHALSHRSADQRADAPHQPYALNSPYPVASYAAHYPHSPSEDISAVHSYATDSASYNDVPSEHNDGLLPAKVRLLVLLTWIALAAFAVHWSMIVVPVCAGLFFLCALVGEWDAKRREELRRRSVIGRHSAVRKILRVPAALFGALLRSIPVVLLLLSGMWLTGYADTWGSYPELITAGICAGTMLLGWFLPTSYRAQHGARVIGQAFAPTLGYRLFWCVFLLGVAGLGVLSMLDVVRR